MANAPTGPDMFFGNCVRCQKAVHGVGRACQAMGRLFHDTCFTCSKCGEQLIGKSFYSVSGRIFCEDDFMYSGVHPPPEVCSCCGHLIVDSVLQALGRSYHPSCFCCVICRTSLQGQSFTVDAHSNVYCVSDYHRVLAPRCASCRKPIMPSEGSLESIRIVAFNGNYHVECYDSEVNLT